VVVESDHLGVHAMGQLLPINFPGKVWHMCTSMCAQYKRTEYNLCTFHRFFIVQAKDVEHAMIRIPTLRTDTPIPVIWPRVFGFSLKSLL
jgi:hypothetical protein